jgi:hypothetical protein
MSDSIIETKTRDNLVRYLERTEAATVAISQTIARGGVLGRVDVAAGASAAAAGNAANTGVMSGFALVNTGGPPKVGTYTAICVTAASNSGKFNVIDPGGEIVGVATVAVAFVGGGITFTIADGSQDFIVGESFTMIVAAGSGQVKLLDKAATDGSQKFHGVALEAVTTGSGATQATCIATAGTFQSQGLSFASGTVLADVVDQMRLKNCFVDTTDADENVMGA